MSYGLLGMAERNPKMLALACCKEFKFRSFWDVGANFGFYSWLLKSSDPSLKTVLIEPLPKNAGLIRKTIERNKFEDCFLIEAGVSDRDGEGILHVDSLAGSTSSLIPGVCEAVVFAGVCETCLYGDPSNDNGAGFIAARGERARLGAERISTRTTGCGHARWCFKKRGRKRGNERVDEGAGARRFECSDSRCCSRRAAGPHGGSEASCRSAGARWNGCHRTEARTGARERLRECGDARFRAGCDAKSVRTAG